MPVDPDKLRILSKRFEAFMERRKINDAADDDEDEDEDEDCELQEPAEAARRAAPGSDLATLNLKSPGGHN
jgi:hypothetical protein